MKTKITVCLFAAALILQPSASFAVNFDAYKIYLKGVMALKSGDFETAKKDYEKVIALDPSALAVYKDLVYLYWQGGNKEKAFETADKINAADGENAQTTLFLATFYLVANDTEKAKKLLDKTLELDPDNETATVYLAAYYYSGNQLHESVEYWNKFLKQQPDSAAGYFQLAMVQEKLSLYDAAQKSYDKVIELNPEAREAYLSKARIYESLGDYPSAIKVYEEYISVYPDNYYVLMYLGKCYFETQDFVKAKDAFIKTKKGLQGDVSVNYWLGLTYERLGQIDKSAEEFEIVAAKEKDVAILARLGYYYSLLKNYSKADTKLKEALGKDPENYEIQYLIGLNCLDWKKYGKAVKYISDIITAKPDFADAYFFLGTAYDKDGDFENAEKAFLKTLEINPNQTRAMNYLGYTYADKGIKLNESAILLERAVTLEPSNGAFIDSLGWLYYRQGKYEEAARFLLAAANLTRDSLIYDHLGDAYSALGRFGDAWVAYALSYDASDDKKIKKKLDETSAKLDKKEFYQKMLLRSEGNYLRLPSLKTGFTMKASSGLFSVKSYVPFNYVRGEGMSIGIPAKFVLGGGDIYIQNGEFAFNPKAIQSMIPAEFTEIVAFAAEIFKGDFLKQFIDAEVVPKGKTLIYKINGNELVLDADTALIKKITKDDIIVEPSEYKAIFASKLPSKMKVNAKKMKFKAKFEASNFAMADAHIKQPAEILQQDLCENRIKKEDEDKSAGAGKD